MPLKKIFLSIALIFFVFRSFSQNKTIDSLRAVYSVQKVDSEKLRIMWFIINDYTKFRADSALLFGEQSLLLSQKIKSKKFESLTLIQIGDAYKILGDYPNALIFYLKRLQMDEHENDAYKRAITLNNISTVYEYENDYERSLVYILQAEKIIDSNNIDELKNLIYQNLCDIYEKQGNITQAFLYGKKSLMAAEQTADTSSIGKSYNNLANVFFKNNENDSALFYYRKALPFLDKTNAFDFMCESYNGISKLMAKTNRIKSAIYFAQLSATLARKMKLNKYYLESCDLLSTYFSSIQQFDNAYYYKSQAMLLKDSVFNDEKAKQLQLLTMKEEIRQKEIVEAAAKAVEDLKEATAIAAEDRSRKLQLLTIGLLIPVLFFLSVLLSKRKIKRRVVEFTGILSLLMLFEYITLLVHPAIVNLTNDTPAYEIIIFISIAAILTPAHHRIQSWLIYRLTVHKDRMIKITTKKIHQKKPE
jgi:tetratricopeptide (TPR) repeat protein